MSTSEPLPDSAAAFDLINCGWSNRFLTWTIHGAGLSMTWFLRLLVIPLICWIPLVLLSLINGRFWGHSVAIPFVMDIEVHIRFLIVLPLLEFSQIPVKLGLITQSIHLKEMGIIHENDKPRFREAQIKAMRLRQSNSIELALLVVAVVMPIIFRSVMGISDGPSSWERNGPQLSAAGYWQMLVSLPVLYFLLLRWIFVIVTWGWFLFQVSRLPLLLSPTHPDHVGGLGFLGWGIVSFAPILMGASTVFAAGVATEIIQHRESLNSLKYHCVVFLAAALIMIYAPLAAFVRQLSNCRFKGLLEFGALVWKYEREFEEKWMASDSVPPDEPLLGSSDVQSMADIATCYGHINEMWLIPFDVKAFAVLILAIILPMVPLLATTVEVREILLKIGELLV